MSVQGVKTAMVDTGIKKIYYSRWATVHKNLYRLQLISQCPLVCPLSPDICGHGILRLLKQCLKSQSSLLVES